MKSEILLIFSLSLILVESCKSRDTSLSISLEKNDGLLSKILETVALKKKRKDDYHSSSGYDDTYHYSVPAFYPIPYDVPPVYYPYDNSGCSNCYPLVPPNKFPSYNDVPPIHTSVNTYTNVKPPNFSPVYSISPSPRHDSPAYDPQPKLPAISTQYWHSSNPVYYSPPRTRPHRPVTESPKSSTSVSIHSKTSVNQDFLSPTVPSLSTHTRTLVTYESVNVCRGKVCQPGHKCIVKQQENCPSRSCEPVTVCTNPCDVVRCAEDQVCRVETENCGSSYCEPIAKCTSLCDGIACPSNLTCSPVTLSCDGPSCERVPVCGGDPCKNHVCPRGEGCQVESSCNDDLCQVKPVCRNPCENVKCRGDEYCYAEEVTCIKAPCNPVPICRNPCNYLHCEENEKCVIEEEYCDRPNCARVAVCKPLQRIRYDE